MIKYYQVHTVKVSVPHFASDGHSIANVSTLPQRFVQSHSQKVHSVVKGTHNKVDLQEKHPKVKDVAAGNNNPKILSNRTSTSELKTCWPCFVIILNKEDLQTTFKNYNFPKARCISRMKRTLTVSIRFSSKSNPCHGYSLLSMVLYIYILIVR